MEHILIFGGTSGLGFDTAMYFANKKYKVTIIGRNPPKNKIPPSVEFLKLDLIDIDDAITQLLIYLKKTPPNHFVFSQRMREKDSKNHLRNEFIISVESPYKIIELSLPYFIKNKNNSITFISSTYGEKIGLDQDASYHICKAAINMLSQYLSTKLLNSNIRINTLSPSSFIKKTSSSYYRNLLKSNPNFLNYLRKKKMGNSNDIARIIELLIANNLYYMSGQNLTLDSGLLPIPSEYFLKKNNGSIS